MKLVGRKFYISVECDEWLEANFGPRRERSRAVDLALRAYQATVEARKSVEAVEQADLEHPE